jgi:hypothetical protein
MRPTNRFAVVIFLLVLLCTSTSATFAQFGPSTQVYVFTPEVASDGSVALRVFATQCTENYQLFFALSRATNSGWTDIPGLIPIGLEPLAPGVSVRKNLTNLKLDPGTYKLSVSNFSRYGNAGRNVDETKYCVSGLRDYAQTENIVFTVGERADVATDAPVILTGDQYARMKEGVVRFGALLPNATRLIFSQRSENGRVRYFTTDAPATPGDFQQLSVELPKNFDGNLPVEVNAQDKSTFLSVSLRVLERNPVVASPDVTTNR